VAGVHEVVALGSRPGILSVVHQENRHSLLGQGYATEPKLGLIGHHRFRCSNIGLVRSQ
jgi:hypothetical protein